MAQEITLNLDPEQAKMFRCSLVDSPLVEAMINPGYTFCKNFKNEGFWLFQFDADFIPELWGGVQACLVLGWSEEVVNGVLDQLRVAYKQEWRRRTPTG